MARKASTKESTAAAVDAAAAAHNARVEAREHLKRRVTESTVSVLLWDGDSGLPSSQVDGSRTVATIEAAWQATRADVADLIATGETVTAAQIADTVAPFVSFLDAVEGPGVEALARATAQARKVEGYRVKVARLLAQYGASKAQIAEACGFSEARGSQYIAAASLVAAAKTAGMPLTVAQGEQIARRGKVTAARQAIKTGDAHALAATYTDEPKSEPKLDGDAPKSERWSDAVRVAADALLAALRDERNGVPDEHDIAALAHALAATDRAAGILRTLTAPERAAQAV